MEVQRLKMMASEIFKSFDDLNPLFMNNFCKKRNSMKKKNELMIHTQNSVTFGSNSLRCSGRHIWNTFPKNIKDNSF